MTIHLPKDMTTVPTNWEDISINTLNLTFDLPVYPRQISTWRGAVSNSAGWTNDLFHNHRDKQKDKYHFRYPLIQYRSIAGKANIWSMQNGVEAVRSWMLDGQPSIQLGELSVPIKIIDLKERQYFISFSQEPIYYRLMNYLPFNSENYQSWKSMDNQIDRTLFLEYIMKGHLAVFLNKAVSDLPSELEIRIVNTRSMRKVRVHNHDRIAYNLIFRTNLKLPPLMALGRSVAFGFGTLQPTKKQ